MPSITIINTNQTVELIPVVTVLNSLGRSAVPVRSVCGGRGNCGTCRLRIIEGGRYITPVNPTERARLGPLIEEGWRLACQIHALRDLRVELPPYANPKPPEDGF